MGMEQETLIYVEENDKEEAKILTKGLLNKDIKSRAYINALGAELGLKYLALENINNSKTYNLHNVHRILEEFDISDIMLSNIHIDVRVVFDENQIFIPKSHFEFNFLPDIYLVFVLAQDSSHVKFLGFFEPKLINKNNQNSDYYFIEKEKLSSPLNLKEFVESFKGNTTQSLSDDINENAQTLMVSVVDQNASKDEVKELLKYLAQSSYLRDRFIEFENFEILSYKAERSSDVKVHEEIAQEDVIDATADDLKLSVDENINLESALDVGSELMSDIGEALSDTAGAAALGAAALGGAALAGEAIVEEAAITAAETAVNEIAGVVEDVADDVSDMFSKDSIPSMLDDNEQEEFSDSQTNIGEPVSIDDTVGESVSEDISQNDDSVINFVDGNADDLFNELGLGESESDEDSLSFDDIDTSKGKIEMEESENTDAVDFSSVEQAELPQPDDMPSGDEMEVLDISNVNAVPNNFDQNISETIEFNNIERSNEPPCLNELNGEETIPMLNMNDFSPLEPLPDMESYKAESYDMDSLSITDNMLPMPKLDMPQSSFEPVDMESLSLNQSIEPMPQAASPEALEQNAGAAEELSSELDSIPDFNAEGLDMGLSDDLPSDISEEISEESQQISDITDDMPSDNLDLPSMDELQNLSVDDIVEAPVSSDSFEETEVPVADFNSLAQVDEFEGVEAASAEIPSIDDTMDAELNDSDEIPELGEEVFSEDSEEYNEQDEQIENSDPLVDESETPAQESEGDDNDLTMLFNDSPQEDEIPQDFNSLNELSQIPTITHYEKPKLPVKMIAVAAVAAVLVIGGVAGLSMKNKPSSSEPEPLAQAVPEALEAPAPIADNTDILANTPEVQTLPAAQKEPVNVKQEKNDVKPAAAEKPVNPAGAFIGVTKLSWEVPDYLSYSANMKKYLQTAGKSIKLTLSSDLLLATEYAYSNQMKVDLQLSSDGTLKDSKIIKSSGSQQIDKIVLQTVKETLNVIKPAAGEVPTPEFRLALIINF